MRINYKVIVISSIITAVVTSVLLKLGGTSIGIPTSWNPGVAGGVAAGVSSILGQVYAKKEESP